MVQRPAAKLRVRWSKTRTKYRRSFASQTALAEQSKRHAFAAGKVFGICWEVSGTEGTILMDGERFNELKISRFNDPKPDRGFKTIYAGSQVSQFSAFFGFDFAGGGLGYFDVKVIEVRDLIEGIVNDDDCFPNFEFGLANERIIDAMELSLETKTWQTIAR